MVWTRVRSRSGPTRGRRGDARDLLSRSRRLGAAPAEPLPTTAGHARRCNAGVSGAGRRVRQPRRPFARPRRTLPALHVQRHARPYQQTGGRHGRDAQQRSLASEDRVTRAVEPGWRLTDSARRDQDVDVGDRVVETAATVPGPAAGQRDLADVRVGHQPLHCLPDDAPAWRRRPAATAASARSPSADAPQRRGRCTTPSPASALAALARRP